jgi:hypothetical protein
MKLRSRLRQQHYIKNQAVVDQAIRGAIRLFLEAVLAKDTAMRAVQQVMAYALLYNRDLSCMLEDLEDPASPTHANMYGRLVILLADECFAKMPILIGKELHEALNLWQIPAETRQGIAQCGRQLTQLKKAEGAWVGMLRDNVIGHRDLAVAKQWRLINELDVNHAADVARRLLEWTNSLYGAINAVLTQRTTQLRELKGKP